MTRFITFFDKQINYTPPSAHAFISQPSQSSFMARLKQHFNLTSIAVLLISIPLAFWFRSLIISGFALDLSALEDFTFIVLVSRVFTIFTKVALEEFISRLPNKFILDLKNALQAIFFSLIKDSELHIQGSITEKPEVSKPSLPKPANASALHMDRFPTATGNLPPSPNQQYREQIAAIADAAPDGTAWIYQPGTRFPAGSVVKGYTLNNIYSERTDLKVRRDGSVDVLMKKPGISTLLFSGFCTQPLPNGDTIIRRINANGMVTTQLMLRSGLIV